MNALNTNQTGRPRRRAIAELVLIAGLSLGHLAEAAPSEAYFVRVDRSTMTAVADVDQNTHDDVVLVDAASGLYTIGYQTAPGVYHWVQPRASGITNVSGLAVGALLDQNTPGLAFTSPEANRINLLDASTPGAAGLPVSVFSPGIGPNFVAAIDIPGGGNDAHDDLFLGTIWNSGGVKRFVTLRNTGGTSYPLIQDVVSGDVYERANRVLLKTGEPFMIGLMARGDNDSFEAYDLSGGAVSEIISLPGMLSGSEYLYGHFAGPGLSQFLFYQPGDTHLVLAPVEEPVVNTFQFGATTTFEFDDPLRFVGDLPGATDTKLLVIFRNGDLALVYDFDGVNPPVLRETFTPNPGEIFVGGVPLGDNGFMALSSDGTTTFPTGFQAYNFDGANYGKGASGTLPALSGLLNTANVFQFRFEPFVSKAPRLLSQLNAGNWSSEFTVGGAPPEVGVQMETFVDPVSGLDNPSPAAMGEAHPLTQFGLVNQYLEDVSLFSLSAATGDAVAEVSISPPAGKYENSIKVTFIKGNPLHQVYYRLLNQGDWILFNGDPVVILTNTTVHYYAQPLLGTSKSIVKSAAYEFGKGPDDLDSDGDGVPDYVETAKGLDPLTSGSDADNDTYSDLEELLAGTDPNDDASTPVDDPGFEQKASFDLIVTPLPLDGINDTTTQAQSGTAVGIHELTGAPIKINLTEDVTPAPVDPSAILTNVFVAPDQPLTVVATEQHYPIVTPEVDNVLGREMVSLLPAPQVAPVKVPYDYGNAGGDLVDEANAWVQAAIDAYNNADREQVFTEISLQDVLAAMVVERKYAEILDARGLKPGANLTLFPFRPTDAGREPMTQETFDSIASETNGHPAYLAKAIHAAIDALVKNPPNADVTALNDVTHEIYRISSALNNDNPGVYRAPLDVLREFLIDGSLDAAYAAASGLAPNVLNDGHNGASFLLASVEPRPVTNLTLRVRPGSFAGPCTTLETDDFMMTPVNLFDAIGAPFNFPDSFNLAPGSVVQVTGHPDAFSTVCNGLNVEVTSIGLQAVPIVSDPDNDGNLLIDTWEQLFLALLGGDAFGDLDGDNYTNLQEMFEGSDPTDNLGIPNVPAEDMGPPVMGLGLFENGDILLSWTWPEQYNEFVVFQVWSTPSLDMPLVELPVVPVHAGGDNWEAFIPAPEEEGNFYSVSVSLQ